MTATTMFLVRHAPTLENEHHILIGHTDPALHETGLEAAKQVALALSTKSIDVICTSPLGRAYATAQAIHLHHPTSKSVVDTRLMELFLGDVEGMSAFDAYETYRERYDEGLSPDTHDFSFPNGEMWSSAVLRMKAALEAIHAAYTGCTVVVVTHGALLGLWRAYLEQEPMGRFRSYQPKHASISSILYETDDVTICEWGNTNHLRST